MKASRILFRLVGLGFITVAVWYAIAIYRIPRSPALISATEPDLRITPGGEGERVEVEETSTETPTQTPVYKPVKEYVLADRLDLGSGMSTTWSIRLPEGGELPGTWAKAIAYTEGDNDLPVSPFNAHLGTIYSLLGDTTVIRAHSGQIYAKSILFASNLDLYLRMTSEGQELSFAEGQQKLQRLRGSMAYLCQTEEKVDPFTVFDPKSGCPGEKVEAELVAGIIIPREMVAEFDLSLLRLRSWLEKTYPGNGFEKLSGNDSFVLLTCVQKYYDQPNIEGLFPTYNRVVLGFRVIEE